MIRRIIKIDQSKCNGCGLCARACHEGAIGIVEGKAQLMREDYCDGLGDCLPACPMNAISFEEREAPAYDEAAVLANKKALEESCCDTALLQDGCLKNFPVQIKLLPPVSPLYDGADLLIAADCSAYAYGSFHNDFMKNRVTLIGCPKLDSVDYSEKLMQIFKLNNIKSVTVTRMTVPCCGGLSYAVESAVKNCGKDIPLNIITIGTDGKIVR